MALSWQAKARPKQLPPNDLDWLIWLIQTGRGWGKNYCASNNLIDYIRAGICHNIALVAPTAADARDMMVDESEQNSGILANSPKDFFPKYLPSKRRLEWPNGAVATTFSAEDPDQLRGPNHDFFWADELAAWKAGYREETWRNLMFTLRKGSSRGIITTTPRPILLLKQIAKLPTTRVTRGSTKENLNNLSSAYIDTIIKPYEGTRVGRQEIEGELLEENDLALFDMATIDRNRVEETPDLDLIIVAVDPTGSKSGHGVGIAVGGRDKINGYLLDDRSFEKASPNEWALATIHAYDDYDANYVVVEKNFGGEMVANTIRLVANSIEHSPIPIKEIFASQGKAARAEPVSGLVQQNRIKHLIDPAKPNRFNLLEDQLFALESGESDDRADAYVWLFHDLLVKRFRKVRPWAGDAKRRHQSYGDNPVTSLVGSAWTKTF